MELYQHTPGDSPLLIDIPHAGAYLPAAIADRLTAAARSLPDTDWHVDRLYDFAPKLGVGLLVATHSRYVVYLNRAPENTPLYAGADNTEVCPSSDFHRRPLYADGGQPDAVEIEIRLETYWRPYHAKLEHEIAALKARFGFALLFDGHSIVSILPRFFEGRLPDLNLGSANGTSADPGLVKDLAAITRAAPGFTAVLDGRFAGGYITRHYGRPAADIHAVQLELAQTAYMDEAAPEAFRPEAAAALRPVLEAIVHRLLAWAENHV